MTPARSKVHHLAALRPVLGVLALLGLLAMHGLGTHGTTHDDGSMPMGVVRAMDPGELAVVADVPAEPERMLLTMGGMCVGILLLGVVLAGGRSRLVLIGAPADGGHDAGSPARARSARPPPDLFALSIQRT